MYILRNKIDLLKVTENVKMYLLSLIILISLYKFIQTCLYKFIQTHTLIIEYTISTYGLGCAQYYQNIDSRFKKLYSHRIHAMNVCIGKKYE